MRQFLTNALMLVTGLVVFMVVLYVAVAIAMIWPSDGTKLGGTYVAIAGFCTGFAITIDAGKRVFR